MDSDEVALAEGERERERAVYAPARAFLHLAPLRLKPHKHYSAGYNNGETFVYIYTWRNYLDSRWAKVRYIELKFNFDWNIWRVSPLEFPFDY